MSIVLSLTGQLNVTERLSRGEARDWLARAAVWFESVGDAVLEARLVRDSEEKAILLVQHHPASPPAEVRLGASGRPRVAATTTAAGPGYHIHLCELLRQMAADFGFTWVADDCTDPTEYFHTSDRGACERSFLDWLAQECVRALGEAHPVNVGMPAAHGYTYPTEVFTPLGPRSRRWLVEVAAEPSKGRDFFPWWNAKLDAAFYRNRALVHMWCDFFWRPPLTEEEGELADQIANDLASAFKLDPAAEFPWGEWLELLGYIQSDEEGFCVTPSDRVLSIELWKRTGPLPESAGDAHIGYRRWPVRVRLDGGWVIDVPGGFATERSHDHTWTGWDQTRTVWFHVLHFTKPDGEPPSAEEAAVVGRRSLPEGEALPPLERSGLRGEAVFGPVEEKGRRLWRLSGVTGAAGELAVCNVYIENESDRDWAILTWHTLRHEG